MERQTECMECEQGWKRHESNQECEKCFGTGFVSYKKLLAEWQEARAEKKEVKQNEKRKNDI